MFCCKVENPQRDFEFANPKNLAINLENEALFKIMKRKKNRKDSFDKKWPLKFIKIEELVESGFFYLQSDDKVQCAFCKLIYCNWKPGDKPMKEHIKYSPKCSFLMTVNKPSQCSPLNNKPKNPRMLDLNTRLSTFKGWPHATISIRDLADCGLYYSGNQDVVTCFYCGVSLGDWEPSDEPIVEHAKYYPQCTYLYIIQTRSGINNIQDALKSEVVQKAKEIFPSSLVEEVVVQHLRKGVKFSFLHYLCEAILEHEARVKQKNVLTRINLKVDQEPPVEQKNAFKRINSKVVQEPPVEQKNDVLQCKICMDSEREVVFQPCGHLISCEKCAGLLTKCPLCRKQIDCKIRTFLS